MILQEWSGRRGLVEFAALMISWAGLIMEFIMHLDIEACTEYVRLRPLLHEPL